MDPYGLRRVVTPRGVLPQQAAVLDPTLPVGEDELAIDVEYLNVDSASFRSGFAFCGGADCGGERAGVSDRVNGRTWYLSIRSH